MRGTCCRSPGQRCRRVASTQTESDRIAASPPRRYRQSPRRTAARRDAGRTGRRDRSLRVRAPPRRGWRVRPVHMRAALPDPGALPGGDAHSRRSDRHCVDELSARRRVPLRTPGRCNRPSMARCSAAAACGCGSNDPARRRYCPIAPYAVTRFERRRAIGRRAFIIVNALGNGVLCGMPRLLSFPACPLIARTGGRVGAAGDRSPGRRK